MAEVEHLGRDAGRGPVLARDFVGIAPAGFDDAGGDQFIEMLRDRRGLHAGNRADVAGHQRFAQTQFAAGLASEADCSGLTVKRPGLAAADWRMEL